MNKDIKQIKNSKATLILANKTSNMYKMQKEKYNQILKNAVTKS